MKDDEGDEEEVSAVNVQRFPVMPSLVSLQLMRNRLHLAQLGRKLMKWTALATSKELRRIGAHLVEVTDTLDKDMKDAYILLARARYFFPTLNEMVLENPPEHPKPSMVRVGCTYRSVHGVKVTQYEILNSTIDPYEHLGISHGGQAVAEAKRAWLELLKRLVMILQLRESFLSAEKMHKTATKKHNVLAKIVTPRIYLTIQYILTELEEKEREEFFRLKRHKQYQQKRQKKKEIKEVGELKGESKEKLIEEYEIGDAECPICLDQELEKGDTPECPTCKEERENKRKSDSHVHENIGDIKVDSKDLRKESSKDTTIKRSGRISSTKMSLKDVGDVKRKSSQKIERMDSSICFRCHMTKKKYACTCEEVTEAKENNVRKSKGGYIVNLFTENKAEEPETGQTGKRISGVCKIHGEFVVGTPRRKSSACPVHSESPSDTKTNFCQCPEDDQVKQESEEDCVCDDAETEKEKRALRGYVVDPSDPDDYSESESDSDSCSCKEDSDETSGYIVDLNERQAFSFQSGSHVFPGCRPCMHPTDSDYRKCSTCHVSFDDSPESISSDGSLEAPKTSACKIPEVKPKKSNVTIANDGYVVNLSKNKVCDTKTCTSVSKNTASKGSKIKICDKNRTSCDSVTNGGRVVVVREGSDNEEETKGIICRCKTTQNNKINSSGCPLHDGYVISLTSSDTDVHTCSCAEDANGMKEEDFFCPYHGAQRKSNTHSDKTQDSLSEKTSDQNVPGYVVDTVEKKEVKKKDSCSCKAHSNKQSNVNLFDSGYIINTNEPVHTCVFSPHESDTKVSEADFEIGYVVCNTEKDSMKYPEEGIDDEIDDTCLCKANPFKSRERVFNPNEGYIVNNEIKRVDVKKYKCFCTDKKHSVREKPKLGNFKAGFIVSLLKSSCPCKGPGSSSESDINEDSDDDDSYSNSNAKCDLNINSSKNEICHSQGGYVINKEGSPECVCSEGNEYKKCVNCNCSKKPEENAFCPMRTGYVIDLEVDKIPCKSLCAVKSNPYIEDEPCTDKPCVDAKPCPEKQPSTETHDKKCILIKIPPYMMDKLYANACNCKGPKDSKKRPNTWIFKKCRKEESHSSICADGKMYYINYDSNQSMAMLCEEVKQLRSQSEKYRSVYKAPSANLENISWVLPESVTGKKKNFVLPMISKESSEESIKEVKKAEEVVSPCCHKEIEEVVLPCGNAVPKPPILNYENVAWVLPESFKSQLRPETVPCVQREDMPKETPSNCCVRKSAIRKQSQPCVCKDAAPKETEPKPCIRKTTAQESKQPCVCKETFPSKNTICIHKSATPIPSTQQCACKKDIPKGPEFVPSEQKAPPKDSQQCACKKDTPKPSKAKFCFSKPNVTRQVCACKDKDPKSPEDRPVESRQKCVDKEPKSKPVCCSSKCKLKETSKPCENKKPRRKSQQNDWIFKNCHNTIKSDTKTSSDVFSATYESDKSLATICDDIEKLKSQSLKYRDSYKVPDIKFEKISWVLPEHLRNKKKSDYRPCYCKLPITKDDSASVKVEKQLCVISRDTSHDKESAKSCILLSKSKQSNLRQVQSTCGRLNSEIDKTLSRYKKVVEDVVNKLEFLVSIAKESKSTTSCSNSVKIDEGTQTIAPTCNKSHPKVTHSNTDKHHKTATTPKSRSTDKLHRTPSLLKAAHSSTDKLHHKKCDKDLKEKPSSGSCHKKTESKGLQSSLIYPNNMPCAQEYKTPWRSLREDSDHVYSLHVGPGAQLGVFEKEVKETIILKRRRQEDGTLFEEKEIVSVKKETRNREAEPKPPKVEAKPVHHHHHPRKCKSQYTTKTQHLADPILRICISDVSVEEPKPASTTIEVKVSKEAPKRCPHCLSNSASEIATDVKKECVKSKAVKSVSIGAKLLETEKNEQPARSCKSCNTESNKEDQKVVQQEKEPKPATKQNEEKTSQNIKIMIIKKPQKTSTAIQSDKIQPNLCKFESLVKTIKNYLLGSKLEGSECSCINKTKSTVSANSTDEEKELSFCSSLSKSPSTQSEPKRRYYYCSSKKTKSLDSCCTDEQNDAGAQTDKYPPRPCSKPKKHDCLKKPCCSENKTAKPNQKDATTCTHKKSRYYLIKRNPKPNKSCTNFPQRYCNMCLSYLSLDESECGYFRH